MSKASKPNPFFEDLKAVLEEGIRFARGEQTLRTTVIPEPPPAMRSRDVIDLRRRLNMSQIEFACTLNVSTKTVQSWEQGSRSPSQAALRLLQVLGAKPDLLAAVVGMNGD